MSCEHHDHHRHHHHYSQKTGSENGNSPQLRKLKLCLLLTVCYLVAEAVGGMISGSLALLADAGHMLADSASLALALFAAWFSQQPASPQKTYGYYRFEILAAFVNGLILSLIAFFILIEAYQRLYSPQPVEGGLMMTVAVGGILVNLVVAWILHGDHDKNLNMKGAYLHVLGDLLGSVGAVLAAILILAKGWTWADPVFGMVIAILVMFSAIKLVLESVHVLLEASPAHINVDHVKRELLALAGVQSVHDLHVWTITSGKDALSAHIVVADEAFRHETLTCIQRCLKEKFGLSHLTLQLETPGFEEDEIHF